MCLVCVLTQLAEERKRAEAATAPTAEAVDHSNDTQAEAPVAPASLPKSMEEQFDEVQLAQEKANVSLTRAQSIKTVADAIAVLFDRNLKTSGLERLLEKMLPVEEAATVAPAAEAVNTRELPPELAYMVEELRAAGLAVEVVRMPL